MADADCPEPATPPNAAGYLRGLSRHQRSKLRHILLLRQFDREFAQRKATSPVGYDVDRLAMFVDDALATATPFLEDVHPHEIQVPAAIMRRARRIAEQTVKNALAWAELSREPWGDEGSPAARAQAALNPLRLLLHRSIDPRNDWQNAEIDALTEAMDIAVSRFTAMSLPLPPGISGRLTRDSAVDRVTLAVCIYRAEQGLTVHHDFDPRTRGRDGNDNSDFPDASAMPNDTAALAAKVLEIWRVKATASQLRTALRNCGELEQSLGRALQASDLDLL